MPRAAVAFTTVVAVVRAVAARPPADAAPMPSEAERAAYEAMVDKEIVMRVESARKFPGEPWSIDDHFHDQEQSAARRYAAVHGVRLGDVLRAIDDGLHAHWHAAATPNPSVPPCRPRLTY